MDEYTIELTHMFDIIDLNYSNLDIPDDEIKSHSISDESIQKKLEQIKKTSFLDQYKEDHENFINRLLNIMIYIDYKTFLSKIELLAHEIIEIIYNRTIIDNETIIYETIYLCALGGIKKSSTWVLLLIIRQIMTYLDNKIKQSEAEEKN